MSNVILFWREIQNEHLTLVGGKALSLGRMSQEGFCVPSGFCLTTAAYCEFIETNRLKFFILDKLESLDYNNSNQLRSIAKEIQEAILQAQIPENIENAVEAAYKRLQQNHTLKVAVRSSAIAEDTPDASFAGQHDTFLGIEGKKALIESVQKCWASLWTARVIQYRVRAGYSHSEAALAVIVQEMVPAFISGVLFTINPITSQKQEMVINATWGLGEALVSGLVEADQIIASRENGKIKECRMGQKQQTISLISGQSGTVVENTGDKAQKMCLTEAQVENLVNVAREIEDKKGVPQDIEWCIAGDTLYILQARPVTSLKAETTGEGERLWTADNAQEAFPGVVSPLTTSFIKILLDDAFYTLFERVGITTEKEELCRFFDGYVYLNVTALQKMIRDSFPGVDDEAFTRQILGRGDIGSFRFQFKLNLKLLYRLAKTGLIATRDILCLPKSTRRFIKKLYRRLKDMESQIKIVAPDGLKSLYKSLLDLFIEGFKLHVQGTMSYALSYGALSELISSLPHTLGVSPSIFLNALGTLEEAKIKNRLWELAEIARNNLRVVEIIKNEEPSQISTRLSQLENASSFQQMFTVFLDEFGHMGDNLSDIIAPRWQEDPSSIWKLFKVQLGSVKSEDPRQLDVQMTKKRKEESDRVVRYLSRGWRKLFPLRKWQFLLVTRLATHCAPYRQNIKFHMLKAGLWMRRIILRWGNLLVEKGCLKTPDDVFYLELSEIFATWEGKIEASQSLSLVETRRKQIDAWQKITAPRHVYTKGDKIVRKVYDEIKRGEKRLQGVSASAGCVTGKARIILDLSESDRLQRGEILVTRFTDPAWTPLFSLASGIVMDIGSVLSHGAVVARELGIPAVVGVRYGTDVIENEQEITVDGSSGTVWLT